MQITFQAHKLPTTGTAVVVVPEGAKLTKTAEALDKKTKGAIKHAAKAAGFKGKKGEVLELLAPAEIKLDRIILVGIGKEKDTNAISLQSVGGTIYTALNKAKVSDASVVVDALKVKNATAADIAYGITLKSYRFDQYHKNQPKDKKPVVKKITVFTEQLKETNATFKAAKQVASGVFLARDVVTEPPNILYPESYAQIIKKELTPLGVKVKILGEKEMQKLGMGSLLGVGQGSIRESQLVVMEYKGNTKKPSEKPIAFVGKGVTFDTGGISLKPSAGMEEMKYDMGGSAAVVGTMRALAGRKAKVNVVGVVGLVENMPGHNAQRPSDVVTSMSGKTIEVLNTDAEGRLVLVDAFTYVQQKHKPKWIIDLATLTGAIVIALGNEHAGTFSNNDTLADQLFKAGQETGEKVWRLPLAPEYDKLLDSPIADVQNISSGRGAGSITAAQFLQRFIENDTPWVHIDIAGMAWTKKDLDTCPTGATGYGVRLLDHLVKAHYE